MRGKSIPDSRNAVSRRSSGQDAAHSNGLARLHEPPTRHPAPIWPASSLSVTGYRCYVGSRVTGCSTLNRLLVSMGPSACAPERDDWSKARRRYGCTSGQLRTRCRDLKLTHPLPKGVLDMKRTGFMAVVAAGVAMLFASSASALDKITVAYFLEWPTANQVAQLEKTYDEAMGVEVEWRAFGNGNEMSQAMVSGDVQIAYSQGAGPVGGRRHQRAAAQAGRRRGELRRGRQLRRPRRHRHHAGERDRAGGQADRDRADRQRHPLQAAAPRWITSASTPPRSTWCR